MKTVNNIFCKILVAFLVITGTTLYAQNVGINSTGAAPNGSAILDLSPNTAGGFLLPYMTTANMNSISAAGATNSLLIYNYSVNCIEDYYSTCSCWEPVFCPCTAAPATPGAPTGNTPVCLGSQTYSVTPVSNASSYTWTLSSGGTFSNGLTTITGSATSEAITWTTNGGPYNITVKADNTCGTSATGPAFAVTVAATAPPVPTITSGPTTICKSSAGNTYTASSAGATSFTWTVNATVGTITSGQGTATITVTANAAAGGPANITCTASNSCLTSGSSAGYAVTVAGAPPVPTVSSGPTTITTSSTGNTYTATSAGATSFTWTVPASVGTITSGQGTATITVTGAAGAGSGNITVTATDACGTSASSANYGVTVTACTEVVTKDAENGSESSTFSITTTGTNELVVVACTGYGGNSFGGSVSVSGAGSPATTAYSNVFSGSDAGIAVYWFVAATAGTYNISINEGNYSNYYNFAVALKGFCTTPGAANFNSSNSNTATSGTSLGATLSEAANSYAIGIYTNYWLGGANNNAWTNATELQYLTDSEDDSSIAGIAIGGAATPTITATDGGSTTQGGTALMLIDVK